MIYSEQLFKNIEKADLVVPDGISEEATDLLLKVSHSLYSLASSKRPTTQTRSC